MTTRAETTSKSEPKAGLVGGFRHFIHEYGVATLAIGVVIGNAVNDLIKSLVESLITPLIGLVSPKGTLQTLQFVVRGSTFKIGMVINAVLSFLIVAWLVYLAVKFLIKKEASSKGS